MYNMKMTKQHFQALAETCALIILDIEKNEIWEEGLSDGKQGEQVIRRFQELCKRGNDAFNPHRFVMAVQHAVNSPEKN